MTKEDIQKKNLIKLINPMVQEIKEQYLERGGCGAPPSN
jgi:hypothetical protein